MCLRRLFIYIFKDERKNLVWFEIEWILVFWFININNILEENIIWECRRFVKNVNENIIVKFFVIILIFFNMIVLFIDFLYNKIDMRMVNLICDKF